MNLRAKTINSSKQRVGFICNFYKDFFLYQRLLVSIPQSKIIIVSHSSESVLEKRYKKNLKNYIENNNIPVYMVSKNNVQFFEQFDRLVFTSYSDLIKNQKIQHKILIKIQDEYGKEIWNLGPWNAFFDKVIVFGDYANRLLSVYGNTVVAEDPRANMYNGKKKTEFLKKIFPQIRKTILYAPTHGKFSSLRNMIGPIHYLSKEYNIVIRPHTQTFLSEELLLESYKGNENIFICDDSYDIRSILPEVDIILGENIEIIIDSFSFSIPTVFINIENEYKQTYNEGLYFSYEKKHFLADKPVKGLETMVKDTFKSVGSVFLVQKEIKPYSMKQADSELLTSILNKIEFIDYKKLYWEIKEFLGMKVSRKDKIISEILTNDKKNNSRFASLMRKYDSHFLFGEIYIGHVKTFKENFFVDAINALPLRKKISFIMNNFF